MNILYNIIGKKSIIFRFLFLLNLIKKDKMFCVISYVFLLFKNLKNSIISSIPCAKVDN